MFPVYLKIGDFICIRSGGYREEENDASIFQYVDEAAMTVTSFKLRINFFLEINSQLPFAVLISELKVL